MKKLLAVRVVLAVGVITLTPFGSAVVLAGGGGFDEYGYNYQARVFVGKGDGIDRILDGKIWGSAIGANDHLVMKWSKAWDDARYHGADWTCGAWVEDEWNGRVPGGSGEVWHYKIVWVGPELEDSPCWEEGGYSMWDQFEIIFSHGTTANEHLWEAHSVPSGLGGD